MELQDIAIADGKVESVRTSMTDAQIIFIDWNNIKWRFTFTDVLAVENLNIEGEDLDRLEVDENDRYIWRVRSLVDEPEAKVNMYAFFTPWKDEPRLRVVAAECLVSRVNGPPPSP